MIDFLQMDGYGFYVWTSYAIALVFLVVNVVWPLAKRRKIARDINARQGGTRRRNRRRATHDVNANAKGNDTIT